MTENSLEHWVIYFNPQDHPDKYVVRKWIITGGPDGIKPDDIAQVCDTLELARDVVAYHYPSGYRLPRQVDDDPAILETWI